MLAQVPDTGSEAGNRVRESRFRTEGSETPANPKRRTGRAGVLCCALALLTGAAGCTGTIGGSGEPPPGGIGNGNSTNGASSTSGGSGTSGGVTGTTGGGMPGAGSIALDGEPLYTRFQRLTNDQWEHSVRDILRLDGPTGAADNFLDAVAGTTDFDNNERVVFVDNTSANDFQLAAEAMADRVTASDAALQQVVATNDPIQFIETFGRRAFRRDLTPDEITQYRAIYDEGAVATATQSAFTVGAGWVIATMLQSPHFLYRIEFGDEGAPLSGYEMAAKLSLFIRDTTPTEATLDAANSLSTAEGAAAKAAEMLEEPSAVAVMRKFHGELHKFALFDSIVKTGVEGYREAMNAEFKEASYAFFDRIFTQGLGVREILTSTVGFAGPNTASIYDTTVPPTGNLTEVELPDRVGYFSQAPFMALWGRNNTPDSIHRGARLNLDVLCVDPGLPDDVPSIPAAEAGETNREVIDNLTTTCARVCHGQLINPVGFAFENFDGLGRYRETDNGQPVDTSGVYPFAEGERAFSGAPELMEHMAAGSQAHQCWSKKMASYALGRDIAESDRALIETLGAVSRESQGSLKQVILALVQSDAFRIRKGGVQ